MANQIVTGAGWLARYPRRLLLRVAGRGGGEQPRESLSHQVITARLLYGGLGACPQGSLTVVDAPVGWLDTLDSREVFLDLETEQGTFTVYRAILTEATVDGRLTTATLAGIHNAYIEQPLREGEQPLRDGYLMPDTIQFGVSVGVAQAADVGVTHREYLDRVLADKPDVDWGGHPNGGGVIGKPSAATPVRIGRTALGSQYGQETEPRYSRTPYLTHAVLRPPEPYAPIVYESGAALPYLQLNYLLQRRTGQASADPTLLTRPETVTASLPANPTQAPILADGQAKTYSDWNLAGGSPHVIPIPAPTRKSRARSARVRIPYTLTGLTVREDGGDVAGVYVTIRTDASKGTQTLIRLEKINTDLALNLEFDYADGMLEGATKIEVYLAPAVGSTASDITLRVDPITAEFTVEYVNEAGVILPPEMGMPPYVGPFREVTLNGCWLVPPAVSDDFGQFASGCEITWQRETATSRVFFGPLPYSGQKRGG